MLWHDAHLAALLDKFSNREKIKPETNQKQCERISQDMSAFGTYVTITFDCVL